MRDTPRTDELAFKGVEYKCPDSCHELVDAQFARELEQDLTSSKEDMLELRSQLSTLEGIIQKQKEALELILSNWPTKEDGMGEFLPVGVKMCRIALALSPSTFASRVAVGKFDITFSQNGKIWVCNEIGEGMEASTENLEPYIERFFNEKF